MHIWIELLPVPWQTPCLTRTQIRLLSIVQSKSQSFSKNCQYCSFSGVCVRMSTREPRPMPASNEYHIPHKNSNLFWGTHSVSWREKLNTFLCLVELNRMPYNKPTLTNSWHIYDVYVNCVDCCTHIRSNWDRKKNGLWTHPFTDSLIVK